MFIKDYMCRLHYYLIKKRKLHKFLNKKQNIQKNQNFHVPLDYKQLFMTINYENIFDSSEFVKEH